MSDRPQFVDRRELRNAVNPIVAQLHRVIATGTEDHDLIGGPDNASLDAGGETVCPIRGTLRNLRIRITAATATATVTITLILNGVSQALSAASGAGQNGTFSNTTNAVDVEPGDLLFMRIVVGGVAQSAKIQTWSLVLEPRSIQ